ncbi:MAG: beta-galactosidase [Armatimonadota bacterium]
MQSLGFDSRSYLAGSERIFLISGEIHYFRVPPDQWRDRLRKLKDAGANCVATYVPWLIHEPAEGTFRFDDPQYDVEAYLDACREVGLWALVRPGPYQYSELRYYGLPGWLCDGYPQIRAQRIDGAQRGVAVVSYLHPLYIEKTRRWYEQVIPRLARHQVAQGGPVAAMQIDNELMLLCGGIDYHPDMMGVGREEGRWPTYLQSRYGTLEAVNAAYEITAGCWADILPLAPLEAKTPAQRRRCKDYQECFSLAAAEYAALLRDWMREMGVIVPIVHNAANPAANPTFKDIVERLGDSFLLGSDHYYTLGLDWAQNNPTPKYALECFASLEELRLFGFPPTVFELPGGSLSDYPPVTPHDAACCYLTNLACGMKGYNYYIFAGGQNPPGAGITTDVYDYGAALSPTGEPRELYYVQQAVARFLHAHPWLADAEQMTDCHLGLCWDYSRAFAYDEHGGRFASFAAWMFAKKGLLLSALCAGHAPGFVDLTSDSLLDMTAKPLLVGTAESLSRSIQQRLVQFVEAGGKVLLAPLVPTLDEHYAPCTILADYLGGVCQQPCTQVEPSLTAFDVPNVFVNGGLYASTHRPASAIITATETRSVTEIGWQYTAPSGGIISVLGFHWTQAMREHEEMLRQALAGLGVQTQIDCDNPNVWTLLRSDGRHTLLFLLNLFSAPMRATVRFRDPVTGTWVDTGTHSLPGISVMAWENGMLFDPVASARLPTPLMERSSEGLLSAHSLRS